MKIPKTRNIVLFTAIMFTGVFSHAATVNWSAGNDVGFADSTGAALAQNNLLRIGYFTITDAAVQALSAPTVANVATLNAGFKEFGQARVGDVFGVASAFQKASTFVYANDATFNPGNQIYIWAYKATDNTSLATVLTTVKEQAIFYEPLAINAGWKFPASPPDTGTTTIDIRDSVKVAGGVFLAGNSQAVNNNVATVFGLAPGAAGAVQLQTVPEPSTLTFLGLATVAAAGARRRKRK